MPQQPVVFLDPEATRGDCRPGERQGQRLPPEERDQPLRLLPLRLSHSTRANSRREDPSLPQKERDPVGAAQAVDRPGHADPGQGSGPGRHQDVPSFTESHIGLNLREVERIVEDEQPVAVIGEPGERRPDRHAHIWRLRFGQLKGLRQRGKIGDEDLDAPCPCPEDHPVIGPVPLGKLQRHGRLANPGRSLQHLDALPFEKAVPKGQEELLLSNK